MIMASFIKSSSMRDNALSVMNQASSLTLDRERQELQKELTLQPLVAPPQLSSFELAQQQVSAAGATLPGKVGDF